MLYLYICELAMGGRIDCIDFFSTFPEFGKEGGLYCIITRQMRRCNMEERISAHAVR